VTDSKQLYSETIAREGFQDPTGTYPREEYFYSSSLNYAARGHTINEVYTGGGYINVDLELRPLIPSQYPKNQVQETVSGHILEFDDTPGNERVLIKHNTGAGVEMRADGTVIVSAVNNKVEVTGADHKVIVEGNGQLIYNGNLNLKVAGDMILDVGGNFNLKANTKREIINGPSVSEVHGNYQFNINGNYASTVTGVTTHTLLDSYNLLVKGGQTNYVEGTAQLRVSDNLDISAEDEIAVSADNINMAANDLSVFGATGTIGGQGIVMYGKGATFEEGVTAPTFHGDLQGTAVNAEYANQAATAALGTAAPGGYSASNTATPATVKPTASILSDYLTTSSRGIYKVLIDIKDVLKNYIDRTIANGGVTNRKLTVNEIRSKLKNPLNFNNVTFTTNAISNGRLNPDFRTQSPPSIGRSVKATPTAKYGITSIGNASGTPKSKRYKGTKERPTQFYPDPSFDPTSKVIITPATKLARGITLAKFLGGYGDKVTLNHLKFMVTKRQLARNLYVHAEIMNTVANNQSEFKDYRLVVAEGVYKRGPEEFVVTGTNYYRESGRAVVYELIGTNGSVSLAKTFDLAAYWKDIIPFDKLILSYDTFNSTGKLHAQIIVELPTIPEDYKVNFNRRVETHFNMSPQVTNELIEIKL
jgi:hypothetical protein